MKVTVLWFDSLKGIGDGYDENGQIYFINTYYDKIIPFFPKENQIVMLERQLI